MQKESLAKEIVAFSNSFGGSILIGVDDKGNILGLTQLQQNKIEEWVMNVARNNVIPAIWILSL